MSAPLGEGAGHRRARSSEPSRVRSSVEDQWRELSAAAPGVIIGIEIDLAGESHCTLVNDNCASVLGIDAPDLMADLGLFRAGLRPEDVLMMRERLAEAVGTDEVLCFEVAYRHPELGDRWLELRCRPTPAAGLALSFYGFIVDVSDRKRLEAALHHEKERAQVTLASIGDAVVTTDRQGIIQYLNAVAEQLTGWPRDDAVGRHLSEVFRIRSELTGDPAEDPVMRCLREGNSVGLANHTGLVARDGNMVSIQDSAAPIRGPDGSMLGVVLVFHDVTEQRQLAGELQHQATHDMLTGLTNRREFDRQLEQLIGALGAAHLSAARRGDLRGDPSTPRHAMCYIDLDQFKVVNDTSGHVAGDELLRQLSEVLRTQVRQMDTLARLGGDEFGLLLRDCPPEKAITVAEGLRRTVEEFRFTWGDRTFRLGASIGLVPLHRDIGNATDALKAADSACYVAKESGRNRVHVFRPDDVDQARRHGELQWVHRIHQALIEDRFVLHAQPIRSTGATERSLHYELLVRMVDENGILLPPGSFLPSAERYQLARRLDRWVVRSALTWLADHPSALVGPGRFWLNLSGESVSDPETATEIADLLDSLSLTGDRLCFEITETTAVANLTTARAMIARLSARGCEFALDDFGSGLSSFAYLKSLPVDYLKIDGVFVQGMIDDPVDRAIVRSINDVGHELGKRTVAECVETEGHRAAVAAIGADLVQGYMIGRPVPLSSIVGRTRAGLPTPAMVTAGSPSGATGPQRF